MATTQTVVLTILEVTTPEGKTTIIDSRCKRSTSLADGFYKSGDILDITIDGRGSNSVGVSPTLVFNSDGVNQIQGEARYSRTENGTDLKFEYTVQNDDNYHLIQLKKFKLNGARITGKNGENATLASLRESTLSSTKCQSIMLRIS